MSKKNPNYRNSFADKFTRWVKGDYDPIAGQMEMNAPDKEVFGDERIRYVHLHIVKSNNYSERMFEEGLAKNVRRFTGLYKVWFNCGNLYCLSASLDGKLPAEVW